MPKQYPRSKEAEEAVIGSIIREGYSIYERCAGWIRDSEAFYYKRNKMLWDTIGSMHRDGEVIDLITVTQTIKDRHPKEKELGGYYISGLSESVATTANVEHYAKIIWEKFIKRETIKTAYKLYNTSFDKQEEKAEKLLHEHSRLLTELLEIAPSRKREISDIIDETIDSLKTGNNIIKFGLPELDNIAGGMTRKEITVIGGRPGHGKTTLIANLVSSLLEQDYKVMLFNREMSNTEMIKKFIVMESDTITYTDLRIADISEGRMELIEMMSDDMKEKFKNLIMYDDVRTLDDAMREIQREKPDVILDDYIQLIGTSVKKERRFEIEHILTEYKWICKKENCTAILVSQLNREIEKRIEPRPKMSDFSESGAIEQTAESALFVFYGFNFNDERYDRNEIEIICDKARYGKIGTYVMGFDGNKCKFYDNAETAKVIKNEIENRNKTVIDKGRALPNVTI
jgi:replicative DNA helicase